MILGAGRVWDMAKNLAVLKEAARQLNWAVVIAGDSGSSLDDHPSRLAAHLLGTLPHHELESLMRRAAIFAHPALYEPFGLAPLEAAASSCALVLGDIESLREVWGEAAVYVPPRDADALVSCLSELASKPERVAELGRSACRRARRYSSRRMAGAYARLYRRLRSGAPS